MTDPAFPLLQDVVQRRGVVVRATLLSVAGSAPRKPGAAMVVARDERLGTIGGGALEKTVTERALALLDNEAETLAGPWAREVDSYPLGPALGQCCGGFVRVLFEVMTRFEAATLADFDRNPPTLLVRPTASGVPVRGLKGRQETDEALPLPVRRAVRDMLSGVQPRGSFEIEGWFIEPWATEKTPLYLYGAGHVGRAVVEALRGLDFDVNWVDTAEDRFPEHLANGVRAIAATDPAEVAGAAPAGAFHVVMTYSHAIDFDVCRQVLSSNRFAYLGVIASKTKRARFLKRLREAGIPNEVLERLHAPIGLPELKGDTPHKIAISLAADLLLRLQAGENTTVTTSTAARPTAATRDLS